METGTLETKTAALVPPSSKVRWLFLGVGVTLLALLLASGLLAVRLLEKIHQQELAVTRALAERGQLLSTLSLSVQNYSEAVRQFVVQAQAAPQEPSHQRLDLLALEIDSDFNRYPIQRDSAEAAFLDELRDVFAQQRTVYILATRPDERRHQAQNLIANQVAPLEAKMQGWTERLRAWNGERIANADQSLVKEFASTQNGLTRALAFSFGSGFLLVLAGLAYIVRLERQTHSRYMQLAHSQGELHELSARLVDAQETERRSLARELHDEIGQSLGALLVDLGRLTTISSGEMKAQLESMKAVTERTFQEVRNIALLLRPSMLDDLGLVAALEWQGREVSRRSEIEVDVQSENVSDQLPDEYRVCVYRLVQEALNNAVRHSGAKNAQITVRQDPKCLTVRVTDDGKGFRSATTRGLGLVGMEERVKRLGGKFSVESKPDVGTTISAELPIPVAGDPA